MGIDKIQNVNFNNGYNKINKNKSLNKTSSSDSVNISEEAINKAETSKIMDIVKNSPDIREDKVREAKENINNPDYINEAIAKSLADKIMDLLEI